MRQAGALWIQDQRYEVADRHVPQPADTIGTSLVQAGKGLVEIFTGVEEGELHLTVKLRDAPPEQLRTEEWEAVFDVSITSSTGDLRVRPFPQGQTPDWCPSLAQHGPGEYRLRCHRRTQNDGDAHLLSVWPAPHQPLTVHKQPALAPLRGTAPTAPQPPHPGRVQPGTARPR